MLILTDVHIDTDDAGAQLAFDIDTLNGRYRLVHNGDDLTIQAKETNGRWKVVDRLTSVNKTDPRGPKGGYAFEGTSSVLVSENGLHPDDARVAFTAKGDDDCPTCH